MSAQNKIASTYLYDITILARTKKNVKFSADLTHFTSENIVVLEYVWLPSLSLSHSCCVSGDHLVLVLICCCLMVTIIWSNRVYM